MCCCLCPLGSPASPRERSGMTRCDKSRRQGPSLVLECVHVVGLSYSAGTRARSARRRRAAASHVIGARSSKCARRAYPPGRSRGSRRLVAAAVLRSRSGPRTAPLMPRNLIGLAALPCAHARLCAASHVHSSRFHVKLRAGRIMSAAPLSTARAQHTNGNSIPGCTAVRETTTVTTTHLGRCRDSFRRTEAWSGAAETGPRSRPCSRPEAASRVRALSS